MEKVLIDSDIIIDFLRTGKGLLPVLLSLQKNNKAVIYISSVSIFELFAGQSSKKDKIILLSLISTIEVMPFDQNIAQFAGEIKRDDKISIALADFFIGVTSIYFGARLATRNEDHFRGIKGIKFFKSSSSTIGRNSTC